MKIHRDLNIPDLLDTPDFYWDRENLESLYHVTWYELFIRPSTFLFFYESGKFSNHLSISFQLPSRHRQAYARHEREIDAPLRTDGTGNKTLLHFIYAVGSEPLNIELNNFCAVFVKKMCLSIRINRHSIRMHKIRKSKLRRKAILEGRLNWLINFWIVSSNVFDIIIEN